MRNSWGKERLLVQKRKKSSTSSTSNNNTNTTNTNNLKNDQVTTTKSNTQTTPGGKINPNNNNHSKLPAAFGIGLIAGTCGSLAGMGGGFIMIPLMTSKNILSLSQHVAHGTSLFAVVCTGIAGAFSYATATDKSSLLNDDGMDTMDSKDHGNANTNNQTNTTRPIESKINIESAISITICAMMTARYGALYSNKLSQQSLKKVLGVFMICVSPIIPLKVHYINLSKHQKDTLSNHHHGDSGENNNMVNQITTTKVKDVLISGTIGLGSGFMAGLLGVGGGAVVVPALTLSTSMDHYTALGTSLAAMVLPATVGTMTHIKKGNVNLRIAPLLAVGSLIGAYGGGRIGVDYLKEETLQYGFSSLLLGLGLKTFLFKV